MRTASVLVGLALLSASSASAQVFYGVTRGGKLVSLDVGAQSVSAIGNVSVGPSAVTGLEDCDLDASGQLYAVGTSTQSGFPPVTLNRTYRINTSNASGLLGADLGGVQVHSLAFKNASAFYSVNFVGGFPTTSAGNLLNLNPSSGAFSSVAGVALGLPGSFRVDALALSPGGQLYGVWDGGSSFMGTHDYKLISVNQVTGTALVIGSIGTGAQYFESLRFDAAGAAYTVDSVTGNVFSVNLSTGQGTFLFAGGALAQGLTGLAFVPSPGALGLAGVTLIAGARRRRS